MKPTISIPYAIAGAAIPLIPLIILALVLLTAKPAQPPHHAYFTVEPR